MSTERSVIPTPVSGLAPGPLCRISHWLGLGLLAVRGVGDHHCHRGDHHVGRASTAHRTGRHERFGSRNRISGARGCRAVSDAVFAFHPWRVAGHDRDSVGNPELPHVQLDDVCLRHPLQPPFPAVRRHVVAVPMEPPRAGLAGSAGGARDDGSAGATRCGLPLAGRGDERTPLALHDRALDLADRPGAVTDGMGVATNPVFVQDLAIWLPAAAVVALGLWRRRPWGALLAGAVLVFWFIESVGIAVDQWFGSTADPASTVTSMTMVPAFAGLAVIGLVPLWTVLRSLRGTHLD